MAQVHDVKRLLVDARDQKEMPQIVDLFYFVGDVPTDIRCAAVISETTDANFLFLETTARNRGIQFKLFDNRDDALRWLDR